MSSRGPPGGAGGSRRDPRRLRDPGGLRGPCGLAAGLVAAIAAGIFLALAPMAAGAQDRAVGPDPGTGAVLDVPFLPQSELLCGGAAATMVLRYWGATGVYPEDFRSLVRPDEGGIRGGELADEVRRRGWRALSFRGSGPEVRSHVERGRPVIALIEVGPERYHFVVVVAWTDDAVVFHDPAEAPFQTVAPEEFRTRWRPTDRWSLLVLPEGDGGGPTAPSPSIREHAGSQPDSSAPREACDPAVDDAVARARAGDDAGAESILRNAAARCPRSARIRVELAGIHAGRGEWERAARLSEEAVELDPSRDHAWRILGTSRFLTDDRPGALAAWNRVGEPRIERIRLEGLDGARFGEVQRRLALSLDELLTPESLRLASRRLSLLPSARETRVRYRTREDGRVEVVGTVLQRPVLPSSVPAWAAILGKGAVTRSVTVSSGRPFGAGELWTLEGRWEENRPGLLLGVAVPDAPFLLGVVSLRGGWERQAYLAATTGEGGIVREERRMARVRATDWWTGRVRWNLEAGLDRWLGDPGPSVPTPGDGSLDAVLGGGLELRTLGDDLSLRMDGGIGALLSGSPARTYLTGGLHMRWRSFPRQEGFVAHFRARARGVSDDAPLAAWPGAGDGRAREGLLRAHALLGDGVIVGEAFGRTLVDGGVEGRWWTSWLPRVPLAVAGFVDVARPWRTLGALEGDGRGLWLAGTGFGLRLALPGRGGAARVDLATDLRGGGWRFHAGWEASWPGL